MNSNQEVSCDFGPFDPIYTRKETAKLVGVAVKTLANWTTTRPGYLPFTRSGGKIIYHYVDIAKIREARQS